MAMSKLRKGGKKSWSPSSAVLPQASELSSPFGSKEPGKLLKFYLGFAVAFLLGFAVAAVLHAWLSAPQAVIYWTAKDAGT